MFDDEVPPPEAADVLVLDDPGEEPWSPEEEAAWLAAMDAYVQDVDDGSGSAPADLPARDELRALLAAPPSAHVLVRLTALEATGLDPHEQVLALRLWERAGSWVTARSSRALRAVVPDPAPAPSVGRTSKADLDARTAHDAARLEVGCALRLSTGQVRARLAEAHQLHEHPATASALEAGDITLQHARTIVDGLSPLQDPVARERVEAQALETAATRTVRATRDRLRRLVLTVDPDSARTRHEQAERRRDVTLTPLPDGMAEVTARLAAQHAVRAYDALCDVAGRVATPDDDRTAAQRRADTLVDVLVDAAETGDAAGTGTAGTGDAAVTVGAPPRSRRRPLVGLVVAASTVAGRDDAPGDLAGYGPLSADQAREITADATLVRLLVDPLSGRLLDLGRTTYEPSDELAEHLRARDRTCRAPGCAAPAGACQVDHRQPWRQDGHTSDANCDCYCPAHHRCKDHSPWDVVRQADGSTTWTSPTGHTYRVDPPTYDDVLPGPRDGTRDQTRNRADGADPPDDPDDEDPPF